MHIGKKLNNPMTPHLIVDSRIQGACHQLIRRDKPGIINQTKLAKFLELNRKMVQEDKWSEGNKMLVSHQKVQT